MNCDNFVLASIAQPLKWFSFPVTVKLCLYKRYIKLNHVTLLTLRLQIWQYHANQSNRTEEPKTVHSSDSVLEGRALAGGSPTLLWQLAEAEAEAARAGQAPLNRLPLLSEAGLLWLRVLSVLMEFKTPWRHRNRGRDEAQRVKE